MDPLLNDLALQIIKNFVGGIASTGGAYVLTFTIAHIRKWFTQVPSHDVKKVLEAVGNTNPHQIREVVEGALAGLSPAERGKLTPADKEQVVAVLSQFTHGARTVTTYGQPRSSLVRSTDLIATMFDATPLVKRANEVVHVNWVLKQFLGKGGFGEVWLAENREARGLPPMVYKFFTHEGAQEWIRKEKNNLLAVMQKLGSQPHIVPLSNVVIAGEQHPFLVMEYVPGGSLQDWILEDHTHRLSLKSKHEIIRGVVSALAKAHQQGIYHRDLKPANILLTDVPDVQAKIADFGLAQVDVAVRSAQSIRPTRPAGGPPPLPGAQPPARPPIPADALTSLTTVSYQVGTPMYWPPEANEPLSERHPAQDDVFAVGVVWYQLLVEKLERPPYDFAEALRKSEKANTDSQTIRFISNCLARPDRRYKDAGELAEDIGGTMPPEWPPVPPKCFDVSHIVREYLTTLPQ